MGDEVVLLWACFWAIHVDLHAGGGDTGCAGVLTVFMLGVASISSTSGSSSSLLSVAGGGVCGAEISDKGMLEDMEEGEEGTVMVTVLIGGVGSMAAAC